MEKVHNYGVDLLRLVLMYMVCMLHTLGQGGILSASVAGTPTYNVFWFLEILSYCAVDGFAIISGYMAKDAPKKYEKLMEMWFQAVFYSFVVTLLLTILGVNATWSKMDILRSLFPVTFEYFWYFTSFFALFLAMPLLNRFLFSIDTTTAKKAFLLIVLLFSVMGIIANPFKTNHGYSATWLMVLYCIGVLAKRIALFERKRSRTLLALWALCIFLTWGIFIFGGSNGLINYVSPTILLSGILMVVLFSRIQIKGSLVSFVKKISPLAFGIYLFQLNGVIWNQILRDAFAGAVAQPLFIGVGLAFLFAFAIFLAGLAVEYIRSRLAKLLRIPALSHRIALLLDAILCRLCTFLD